MKTCFTISKYLLQENEPSEVKKSGNSRKVEKSTFCDFAGPSAFVVDLIEENEVSRGSKALKARKAIELNTLAPLAPRTPPC